ncbi:proton channel OTOP2 [Eucyclogobius newberryi]|uniref:proton channel OTOP2 n=1 Tax=Eucyclogobius newberryi TaxID=166745 RepID=UPI003B5B86D0
MCLNTDIQCKCLLEGDPCEPCKMMEKHNKAEETHLSNTSGIPEQAESTCEPDCADSSAVAKHRKESQNWGWMVSGIISMNVLILGCALVCASAYKYINISKAHLQIYLVVLLILTTAWMIYYAVYTARQEHAIVYQDSHAGPIWLRGGLVLFGVLSVIMNIFKIASYVGYIHCESAIKVAFPVIKIAFISAQTYFLWFHAKDCLQVQKNLSRCGIMLTLSTNLVMWMTLVTEESLHQTTSPENRINETEYSSRSTYIARAGFGDDECTCSHSSCSIFKVAYYYLYPFNIEYSLFASTMAFIMWKNVGRLADKNGHPHFIFRLREVVLGPVVGLILLIAGIATFIIYEMELKIYSYDDQDSNENALMMHFVMNIVIVTLMSLATVLGCGVFKLDHRDHVSEKNPTRNLDVGLLVGASLGQFIVSYFSIVAMIATGASGYLNRLNLTWAIIMVIQLGLQNFFIIEGLHREPHHEIDPSTIITNPYPEKEKDESRNESGASATDKNMTGESVHCSDHCSDHCSEHLRKLAWKRRIVKEVCTFLLMCNIILWIMPAFGARPQFDHDTEITFFTFNVWTAVVNIGLPFGIFYRMHSVASLFEVFLRS